MMHTILIKVLVLVAAVAAAPTTTAAACNRDNCMFSISISNLGDSDVLQVLEQLWHPPSLQGKGQQTARPIS
jgi:hypothetical protein